MFYAYLRMKEQMRKDIEWKNGKLNRCENEFKMQHEKKYHSANNTAARRSLDIF